jgi:hypothetical protein
MEKVCGLVALEIAVTSFLQNCVIFSEAKHQMVFLLPAVLYSLVLSIKQLILQRETPLHRALLCSPSPLWNCHFMLFIMVNQLL